MNLSREICIYEKEGDKLLASIPINNIELSRLINILNINEKDDPYVCKIYHLSKSQLEKLSKYIPELLKYNFENFSFYFECFQI